MSRNPDISRPAWIVVAVILCVDGVRAMATRQIFGKVRLGDSVPWEGGWVFLVGALELALGVYLLYRLLRR